MGSFKIDSLSVERKIGQLFFIGIPGPNFDEPTREILHDIQPGGVCLFARNIKEAAKTRELLDSIHDLLPVEPFLSLDQEGGRVDRLRRIVTPMPAASQLRDVRDAAELGDIVGEMVSLLGFNMDFAPVVDVIDESRKDFVNGLQTRGFGRSKEDVVEMATAFLEGLRRNRILGCLKHFPGLAAARVDSHEELPVVTVSEEELEVTDLHPYREMLRNDSDLAIMVAHVAYPNTRLQEIDDNGKLLPSSLSERVVTSLLRENLNFSGVAITDDLEMGAIVRNYGIGEACKMAIKAGEDVLAICASPASIYEGFNAIKDAVASGEITGGRIDESLGRIAQLKAEIGPRVPFDGDRLSELSARMKDLNENLN